MCLDMVRFHLTLYLKFQCLSLLITLYLMLPYTMNVAVRFGHSSLVSNFLLQAIVSMCPSNFSSSMKTNSLILYLQYLPFCMYLRNKKYIKIFPFSHLNMKFPVKSLTIRTILCKHCTNTCLPLLCALEYK